MGLSIRKPIAANALSMTPLIDVVFLLLIFFLVASQFANEDRQLPLKLPSADSAMPMTVDPEILVINVAADGKFYVDGKYLSLADLKARVESDVRDNPISQTVLVRGDRDVPYQAIVSVLDICHSAKVPSYKLTTSLDSVSSN